VTTATRKSRRSVQPPPVLTTRDLDKLRIVLTPGAREIISDEATVRSRLRESAVGDKDAILPEEIVLWRGEGEDRVVAVINRYVRRAFIERFGASSGDPSLDDARRNVDLAIGSRPDLPPGVEYVRRMRGIWRGLLPRGPS
jgi:hypothetical protein